MSTTPVTPISTKDAIATVEGDFKDVAKQAVTEYANLTVEAKADFHKVLTDLEALYGSGVSALRNLFPSSAPSPAPVEPPPAA